ncbi:Nucleoside-diphosphate-sugar epimerase [Paenibacillus sp. UNC496MF]|uniref:NAD-dependent epimerase/dehydratase family protein n=1 Tax=Paenibacillus sp. UNC496MF TaxID=1502753 RepID=UPI0008F2D768|nr:NAD-dependent epimerase/dehydratase family protein [Paenibacillus sp. UNC496MF]SFJ03628.1 Nucleoside-diphosphate-sugar epimerase [Paenibacillus sp. UNC496MF]
MSGPRLLVTGAGGFCGEHACRHFAALGWRVVAAVRRLPEAGAPERAWLGAAEAVLASDLASRAETEALVADAEPDYVLHLAGANAVGASWSDPAAVLQSNVMGTVHLLEGVRRRGKPCRVLVAGSLLRFPTAVPGVEGDGEKPQHPYALSKTMQVLVARSWASLFGLEVLVAEPSNLIGPGRSGGLCGLLARYAAAAERAAADGGPAPAPFRFSSRTERRDLLDVRDAVAAYETLLRAGESGRAYAVASGAMRTLGEIAGVFGELARAPLPWEFGDSDAASPAPADPAAVAALGWAPRHALRTSLRDALEDARSRS